jgi:hypothetical protein
MSLVEYAKKELSNAGLFDKDSDYDGMLGNDVLVLIETFASQGHSGHSAHQATQLAIRLMQYKPLTAIENPLQTGEYISHDNRRTFQSTRLSSLFSEDEGKRWYDIALKLRWIDKLLRRKRRFVTFPYTVK